MGLRILQLPLGVANQIAAGEVIERPASVVKELLENALDAGADSINIEIDFGGFNQIKVSDNGVGIVADDLILAISAHATSKIVVLDDLYSIRSMGFRGEALASIASVSRLSLSSKTAEQEHAMMVCAQGTSSVQILPCARSQGTTVEVRDLFFNAPVRKKFLKTERIEYQAIEMVVKRFSLSAPTIALTLKHNGKPTLTLPAAKCEKTKLLRIQKLLGKMFVEQAIYLDIERLGMHLQGWISGPEYHYSQNDKQWVYINQRMVKDKLINQAIKQAYENKLHPGRNPACLLYLNIPPQEVDVNVHPTKYEVRFQQPRLIHDLVTSQIVQALTQHSSSFAPPAPLALEVQETYISQPLHPVSTNFPAPFSALRSWTILNAHFALLFLNEQPYLVDVIRLHRAQLMELLQEQPRPLLSRPLLVPIIYSIMKKNFHFFEDAQAKLIQFGLDIDLLSEEKLVVRTTPVLLPQLDIKQLIEQLNKTRLATDTEFLQAFVACQAVDARQLTLDEQADLTAFLMRKLAHSQAVKFWCLPLDITRCNHILSSGHLMHE